MKVKFVKEIPQWVIESDKAAYHPASNTIYLTKWQYLIHELLHWLGHKLGGRGHWIHNLIDKE